MVTAGVVMGVGSMMNAWPMSTFWVGGEMYDDDRKGRSGLLVQVFVGILLLQTFFLTGPSGSDVSALGTEGFEIILGNTGTTLTAVSFTPGGDAILVGYSGLIKRYNGTTGALTDYQEQGMVSTTYHDIDVSGDGEALIVGDSDTALTIDDNWLKHQKDAIEGHQLYGVSWREDGAYAIAVGENGVVGRYYPESAGIDELNELEITGIDTVIDGTDLQAIDWRPDDSYALVVGYGHFYKLTADTVTEPSLNIPFLDFYDVEWCPDGSKAILVGDRQVVIWDASLEAFENATLPKGAEVRAVAWQDESTAYMMGQNGSNKVIFKYSGSTTLEDLSPASSGGWPSLNAIAFNSDGTIGLTAGTGVTRFPNQPPAKVTGLAMTDVTETTVTVSHSENEEADFAMYEYHISTEEGFTPGGGTVYGSQTMAGIISYTFTSLTEATTYYVRVVVCDLSDECTASDELEVSTLDVTKPPAVTLSVSDTGYTEVSLSWSTYAVDDFSRYEVFMGTEDEFPLVPENIIDTISWKTSTTKNVHDLTAGTTYYFAVRVWNNQGYSSDSNYVSATTLARDPPEAVSVYIPEQEPGSSYLVISWTVSDTPYFDSYEVYFSTQQGFDPDSVDTYYETRDQGDGSGYDNVYSLDGSLFHDGVTYYFIVRTVDTYGLYSDSAEVTGIYDGPPTPVWEVSVKGCTAHSCTVTWEQLLSDKPADFAYYQIYKYESGKEKKVARESNWKATSYEVKDLDQTTTYRFAVQVVDKSGQGSSYSWTNMYTTEEDEFAAFFEIFEEPGCLCGGGFFVMVIFISMLAGLGKQYGAKGVAWGIPLLVFLGLFIGLNGANLVFEMDLPTWFLLPILLPLCIILSILIGTGGAAYSKYKSYKWRQEEAARAEQRRQEEFRDKKAATSDKLTRLEKRMADLRGRAPVALHSLATRHLAEGRSDYDRVVITDDRAALDSARNHADDAEKVIVDIEAYIVAKEQASRQLDDLSARVEELKRKQAPRIDVAVGRLREAKVLLEEAIDVAGVKRSIEEMGRLKSAIEESMTSLKSAEAQLEDMRAEVASIENRVRDISEREKEKEAVSKVSVVLAQLKSYITKMEGKPDLDLLAQGREKARDAKTVLNEINERERERMVLLSDLESLMAQRDETSTWTIADLGDVDKKIERARTTLDRDQLDKVRSAIDDGFGLLETISETNKPRLEIVPVDYEMQINRWEDLVVSLKNEGTAIATDIDIDISSPSAQLQELGDGQKSTFKIRPGDENKVPVPIQFTAEGAVPLKVFVSYTDYHGETYEVRKSLRVNVVFRKRDSGAPAAPTFGRKEEDYGLKIRKRGEISQGFYKYKVSIQNKGEVAVRDVNFRLIYDNKIFRLHHIWPREYKLVGDSVDYGDIDPGTTTSVEFYLEAHMCTETVLDGVITFKDMAGQIRTISVSQHRETFVCPVFIDVDSITPAQVKSILSEPGWKSDTWTYAIPSSLNLQHTFDIMKEAIERFDSNLKNVFDDRRDDPMSLEAWYYGETKGAGTSEGIKHVVIGRVQRVGNAGTLQITGASPHKGQLFALSSRLGAAISENITKQANLTRPIQQIFQTVEIKDSVIQGSEIKMGVPDGDMAGGVAPAAAGKTSIKDSTVVRSDIGGGGDVEVEGSVLQRSKVGTGQQPTTPTLGGGGTLLAPGLDPSKEMFYNIYRETLRNVYEDDIVTMDERNILKGLREQLKISMEEHGILEEEVISEREAEKKRKGREGQ